MLGAATIKYVFLYFYFIISLLHSSHCVRTLIYYHTYLPVRGASLTSNNMYLYLDFRKAQLWAQTLGSKLVSDLISSSSYVSLYKFFIKVTCLGYFMHN